MKQEEKRLAEVAPFRQAVTLASMAIALSVAVVGCDRIIGVEQSPYLVVAEDGEVPSNARLLVGGVVNEFECAFNRYVVMGGLFGNELRWANTSPWGRDASLRNVDPSNSLYAMYNCDGGLSVYKPISTARWYADHVLNLLSSWTDGDVAPADRTALIAETAAYAGYSYILMGEAMCTAAFDLGPEMAPPEIFDLAADRFAEAIHAATASGRADLLNLARVGRARALLNQGQATEAATVARLVPHGFRYYVTNDEVPARRRNYVQTLTTGRPFFSLSVDVQFRDVRFNGTPDPRLRVERMLTAAGVPEVGTDEVTPMYHTRKYPDRTTPIALARWEEAQLIIAEAVGGQEAVDIINSLHDAVGLPHFHSTDAAEIQAQIIYERQAELFLESHHLGDMRRYGLEFRPPAGSTYEGVGAAVYGDQRCYPLPTVERLNNPNINK